MKHPPTHYELYDPLSGRMIIAEKFKPPAKSLEDAKKRVRDINRKLAKHNTLNRVRLPLMNKQLAELQERTKASRLEAIREQINALTKEYLELVAPTPQELEEARRQIADDGWGGAEVLSDPDDCLGQYMIADEVLFMRSDDEQVTP